MRFGLLGPLHAQIAGRAVPLNGPRQTKMLAALLIDANNIVAMERLVAVMWDGNAPATAVRQVQDAVSGLRRNLVVCGAPGSLISTRRGGYEIHLARDQLDLLEFDHERHLAEQRTAPFETALALRRALACWRGSALADTPSQVLEIDAAGLNEKRAATHKQCLAIELDLGRHREVIDELTVLLREHPYDEQVAEHLMVALYRCGRQGEALQAYERLRRTLADELGVDPTPPLQALHQRILTADPALAAPVPAQGPSGTPPESPAPAAPGPAMAMPVRQLPLDVTDFVGRAEALAEIAGLLDVSASNRAPVAVIVGSPGVGKSSLVTHAARLASANFPDGQLYLNLAATSDEPRDPGLMLAEALRALSIAGSAIPNGLSERAALYRSLLVDRHMLVVLDDAGHADQVLPLLPGADGCAVLITSRTLLTQLPGARHIDLDVLSPAEARELFTGIVGRRRVEREPGEADAILDCCGNLPLAIRIAGGKLAGRPAWSLRVLRERIEDESRRLAELRIGDLNVRASVELSLRLLPADAVRALSLLGLLGPYTLPGWVVGPLLDRPDGEEVLDTLVDASLVRLTATDAIGQPRYRLHDLIRTCAVEIAAPLPTADKRDAIIRVLSVWLDLVRRGTDRLPAGLLTAAPGSAPRRSLPDAVMDRLMADPFGWFDAERDNLLGAVKLAVDRGLDELAWELAAGTATYYDHRCLYQDWQHGHRLALDAAEATGNARGASVLLRGLGQLHIYQDEFDRATRALDMSIELCRDNGDKRGEALSVAMLSTVSRVQGRDDEALERVEQALAIAVGEGDRDVEAQLSCSMAVMRLMQGQLEEAESWFTGALNLSRALDDEHRVAVVLRRFSRLHDRRGDPDEALRCLWQASATFERLADERCTAYTLLEVGRVYAGQDDRDQASPALERAAGLFHRHGDRQDEATCWQLIGDLDAAAGSHHMARQHRGRALRLWQTIGEMNQTTAPARPSSP
ncbi:tetratricopeptide repeat protein [Streptomyces sp. So13.3]|uniref:AfsR/SARP family transcriptional regulator n=1 Tax=Streptomyces TaxID=1883 RepID=UPI00110698E6|nr:MULTISPECIES: BTAD domain-containing putative transcriptional regulator [Streptomyces]MCZ4102481.1 BTAD domain-containing putative transcriptional regulator [Streptomyces sp. H39-C1]QNA76446.1 tetratricopeptide repeat protein [Streptomyces sp. So13.3]